MANARQPSLVCLSRRWQTLSQLPLNDNSTTTSVNSVQRTRRDRLPYADELDAPADFLLNRSLIILYIMDQQKRSDGVAQLLPFWHISPQTLLGIEKTHHLLHEHSDPPGSPTSLTPTTRPSGLPARFDFDTQTMTSQVLDIITSNDNNCMGVDNHNQDRHRHLLFNDGDKSRRRHWVLVLRKPY